MEVEDKQRKVCNRNCCVFGCKSRKSKHPHVHFHHLPTKPCLVKLTNKLGIVEKIDRRKAWIKVLQLGKKCTPSMVVCSEHFKREDYYVTYSNRRLLRPLVVPSLNLPKSSIESPRPTAIRLVKRLAIKKAEGASPSSVLTEQEYYNSLSEDSKNKHEECYKDFTNWQQSNDRSIISEDVLMNYVIHLSKSDKSNSLVTIYSILKTIIMLKHKININDFIRVQEMVTPQKLHFDKELKTLNLKQINHIFNAASNATDQRNINPLSEVSKSRYEECYKNFITWQQKNDETSISEDVLVAYILQLANTYKSSVLISIYYMLKGSINTKHNINIGDYKRLSEILMQKSKKPVTPQLAQPLEHDLKFLNPTQIKHFLDDAPNGKYLLTKVALIFGVFGGLTVRELCTIKLGDLKNRKSSVLVEVSNGNCKNSRSFTISKEFYDIHKKYAKLRSKSVYVTTDHFFLKYFNGRVFGQIVDVKYLENNIKDIAIFLKLPQPELYEGQLFKTTSGKVLDSTGKLMTVHAFNAASAVIKENDTDKKESAETPLVSFENVDIKLECEEEDSTITCCEQLTLDEPPVSHGSHQTYDVIINQDSISNRQEEAHQIETVYVKEEVGEMDDENLDVVIC